jgi:hypothetical protein
LGEEGSLALHAGPSSSEFNLGNCEGVTSVENTVLEGYNQYVSLNWRKVVQYHVGVS